MLMKKYMYDLAAYEAYIVQWFYDMKPLRAQIKKQNQEKSCEVHTSSDIAATWEPDSQKLLVLKRWANGIAAYYGVPVYLVGSALRESNHDPRDWDIRCCLPNYDFMVRYGSAEEWVAEGISGNWTRTRWRWSADCVKQTKHAWRATGALNVDFQTQPISEWERFNNEPRLRLDQAEQSIPQQQRISRHYRGGNSLGLTPEQLRKMCETATL